MLGNALTIAIPTFAVLFGVLLNRQETASLKSGINTLRAEMTQLRVDLIRDMILLRDSIHRDMIGLHEWVAAVEARQA